MKVILLFALSAIILSQGYGFAYGATISVATDSSSYEAGEMISVSGSISDYKESDPFKNFDVTIKLVAPNGNIITISQIPPSSDGSYSTSIPAQGPLWKYDGDYTVSASWGSDNNASTTFTFVLSEPEEEVVEISEEEVVEISEEEVVEEVEETETTELTSVSTGPAPADFNALTYSIVFTVAIAFAIMIILYAVSRGSRTKTA